MYFFVIDQQFFVYIHNLSIYISPAGALEDLDKAIELSLGQGNAACQSYTQRALIYKLERRNEEALADFKCAANLGSQFARAQVVQMNPYAAMCNQMLAEVMGKLRSGEYQD